MLLPVRLGQTASGLYVAVPVGLEVAATMLLVTESYPQTSASSCPLSVSAGLMPNRRLKCKHVQIELWSCWDLPDLLYAVLLPWLMTTLSISTPPFLSPL